MSSSSKIEWTDATWNPVTGCDEVSPGCDHCYAKTLAERFRGTPGHYFESGFDVQLRPERLDQPFRWTRPRRIFVNSMSDLFHKDVPNAFVADIFAVMALASQHTFQLLTKRHGRMRSLLNDEDFQTTVAYRTLSRADAAGVAVPDHLALPPEGESWWPLRNVWLGVSVEDQHWADVRIPALLSTPAAFRFISAEPLLGPVNLHAHDDGKHHWLPDFGPKYDDGSGEPVCQAHGISRCWQGCPSIDWVIVGGESGREARPMHPDWARSLRDQCEAAGVPFLFKQWGQWAPVAADSIYRREFYMTPSGDPAHYAHRYRDSVEHMARLGKAAAGRELDGRTHDDYPAGS